jgi:hypothetical protein
MNLWSSAQMPPRQSRKSVESIAKLLMFKGFSFKEGEKYSQTNKRTIKQTRNKQAAHPNYGSELSHAPEVVSTAVTRLMLASSSDPLKVGSSDVMPFGTGISCMICCQSGRMVTSGMSSHHTPSVTNSGD